MNTKPERRPSFWRKEISFRHVIGIVASLSAVVAAFNIVEDCQSEKERLIREDHEKKLEIESRTAARRALESSAASFGGCEERSFEVLSNDWLTLQSALSNASSMGIEIPSSITVPTSEVSSISGQLTELREHIAEGQAIVPPTLVEPKYEEPEYSGAWYLSGYYHSNYMGESGFHEGVVITKGDRFFVVLGADPADGYVRYLTGYVEDTGRVITLDVGLYGRTADVVRLSDRETYHDYQASYKEQVAEAKSRFKSELALYHQAVKEQDDAKTKLGAMLLWLGQEETRLTQEYHSALVLSSRSLSESFKGVICE